MQLISAMIHLNMQYNYLWLVKIFIFSNQIIPLEPDAGNLAQLVAHQL